MAITVFQASDLNQRGRAVLDAARAGEARLRDEDGLSLLMLPEQRVRTLATVVQAAVNLVALEQALALPAAARSPRDYGDWTWLRAFDDEDLHEFVADMRGALLVAGREESPATIEETLYRWRVTAGELADPRRRRILLGLESLQEEDFVEVARPE